MNSSLSIPSLKKPKRHRATVTKSRSSKKKSTSHTSLQEKNQSLEIDLNKKIKPTLIKPEKPELSLPLPETSSKIEEPKLLASTSSSSQNVSWSNTLTTIIEKPFKRTISKSMTKILPNLTQIQTENTLKEAYERFYRQKSILPSNHLLTFNERVKERIRSSQNLLKKLEENKSFLAISPINAVISENTRVLEAHLDSCSNDFDRLICANTKDQFGRNALHYATALGHLESIEILMLVGTNPKQRDSYGRIPLHYCTIKDSSEALEMMMSLMKTAIKFSKPLSESSNLRSVARLMKYKNLRKLARVKDRFLYSGKPLPESRIDLDCSVFSQTTQEILEQMDYEPSEKKTIVKNGFSEIILNETDNYGQTALHFATIFSSPAITRLLIDLGADLCKVDNEEKIPLDYCISKQVYTIVLAKMKFEKKISSGIINKKFPIIRALTAVNELKILSEEEMLQIRIGDTGDNLMMESTKKGNIDEIQVLLSKKFPCTLTNRNGWNTIHKAIKYKAKVALNLFLLGHTKNMYNGAKLLKPWLKDAWLAMDSLTSENHNVLSVAILHSTKEMLRYILEIIKIRSHTIRTSNLPRILKDIEFKSLEVFFLEKSKNHLTPLLLAVKEERLDIIKIFVEEKSDIYSSDERGFNSLHWATLIGNRDIINYFIIADAENNYLRNQKDYKGRKPKELDTHHRFNNSYEHIWDFAKYGMNEKLRNSILNGEFDVNETTFFNKYTPLHLAVENCRASTVGLLLSLGADPTLKTSSGKMSLDYAFNCDEKRNKDLIIKLLKASNTMRMMLTLDLEPLPLRQSMRRKIYAKRLEDYAGIPKFSNPRSKALAEKKSEFFWILLNEKLIEKRIDLQDAMDMMASGNELTFIEFEGLLLWLGMPVNADEIESLAMVLDTENTGVITYEMILERIRNSI